MAGALGLLGHNGGPGLEPGAAFRAHCWRVARAELLPRLPIEVVRLRVKRAAEIGLDYKTYAGARATTGHDLVAFLFSTNALRLLREGQPLPPDRAAKLSAAQNIARLLAVQPPLDPASVLGALAASGAGFDHAGRAPGLAQGWGETRVRMLALPAPAKLPADRVLVIGDTALERAWVEAGRLAGYLPAERYFRQTPQPHAGA